MERGNEEEEVEVWEIPENSELAKQFQINHPQLYKFFRKYPDYYLRYLQTAASPLEHGLTEKIMLENRRLET